MTATGDHEAAGEINRLLVRLTRFLLRHSAEGAFEVRDTVREVAGACGAKADVLAIAEGAVLTVRHRDQPAFAATVHVAPELARSRSAWWPSACCTRTASPAGRSC
jgi:hypothetical protein